MRQFRVTVIDDPESPLLDITLSWRAFPCAATKWDGQWTAQVPRGGSHRISSQEALREVLAAVGSRPWQAGIVHRRA